MVPIALLLQAMVPQSAAPPVSSDPASPVIAPPAADIVVTARPMRDRRESERFIWTITPRLDYHTPMARFDAPICIAAAGLPRPVLTAISERMADVAISVGQTMAPPDCTPNILVLFTGEPRRQIRPLLRQRPAFFAGVGAGTLRRLRATAGPALAWSTVGVLGKDGVVGVGRDGVPETNGFNASRLSVPIRRTIGTSIVLIERDATAGRTTRQIADYAVMRALADAAPTSDAQSILSLFDAPVPPDAVSSYDLAYLSAYYRMRPDQRAGTQRQALSRAISAAR